MKKILIILSPLIISACATDECIPRGMVTLAKDRIGQPKDIEWLENYKPHKNAKSIKICEEEKND